MIWLDSLLYSFSHSEEMIAPELDVVTGILILLLNIVALFYMLSYTRGSAKFKYSISAVAWVMQVFSIFNIFRCVFSQVWIIAPITFTEAFLQVIVYYLIIKARGNVSILVPRGTY